MKLLGHFFLAASVAFLLASCSSTQTALWDTIQLGFTTPDDVTLSLEKVQAAPADLIYIRVDDQPRATMVLAFYEHDQHKWLSSDGALLTMAQGRIVRSLGFRNDLTYLGNTAEDPIRQGPAAVESGEWLRVTDWQYRQQSGYVMRSTFHEEQGAELEVLGQRFQTRLVREAVQVEKTAATFENLFWFEQSTGVLLQSRQQMAPHSPVLHITWLSEAARLLAADMDDLALSMDLL